MKFDWSILTNKDYALATQILGGKPIDRREADLCIAPDGAAYLWRWHLARTDLGGTYFHIQVADDPERPLHDHPWDNFSVILSGGYNELLDEWPFTRTDERSSDWRPQVLQRRAGDTIFRKAEWAHRLLLPPGFVYTMTLFSFGPKRRDWGFWYPDGWRSYSEVTESRDGVSVHKAPTMEG